MEQALETSEREKLLNVLLASMCHPHLHHPPNKPPTPSRSRHFENNKNMHNFPQKSYSLEIAIFVIKNVVADDG